MAHRVITITCRDDIFISRRSFHLREVFILILAGKLKNAEFSTRFVFLLDYTRHHGESIHLSRRGWLTLTEHNVWPPGGLI